MSKKELLQGALFTGMINAVINGAINWFTLDKTAPIAITRDAISTTDHTVFAGAVPLAVSLAFILSTVAYFTVKKPGKPPYFPSIFWLALKNSVYAFGLVALTGLLWQRFMGSIEVSALTAAIITGCVAGLCGGLVDYEVKKTL
jgi:hypothetical protein